MAAIETTAEVFVPQRSPRRVFDYATLPEAAPEYFTGWGPIPAIRSITLLDEGPIGVGTRRKVVLSDGSQLDEEVTVWDCPTRHAYRVSGFRPPLSWLSREACGQWTFTQSAEGTRVRWHYRYELTGPLARPLAALIVRVFMRRAMQRALDAIARRLEAGL